MGLTAQEVQTLEDAARLARCTPEEMTLRLVQQGLRDARRDRYVCPVCAVHDPNAFIRCNRPDCTDGRDPR